MLVGPSHTTVYLAVPVTLVCAIHSNENNKSLSPPDTYEIRNVLCAKQRDAFRQCIRLLDCVMKIILPKGMMMEGRS